MAMAKWITWIIPCIQIILLGVQLHWHRKGMKASKEMLESAPRLIVENGRLWRINRVLVEWIKINHPDSYEDFKSVCLTKGDTKLLQLKECEGAFDEGNN